MSPTGETHIVDRAPLGAPSAARHAAVLEYQRARIFSAMAEVASEHGVRAATVTRVLAVAGVSKKTFYEIFDDRDDCLLAAIEQAVALSAERARAAIDLNGRWPERMRAGLAALLEFFEEEPILARLCLVQWTAAGPAALVRRKEVLNQLAEIIDDGRANARRKPAPLTAEGIVGGALAVISAWLLAPERGPLPVLLDPLMSLIVLPYLGPSAARRELRHLPIERQTRPHRPAPSRVNGLEIRLTYRTTRVLTAIAAQPGLSNVQVSVRAGIADQGQISGLLARLARLQLIENTGAGYRKGAPNAWRLAHHGEAVTRAISHQRLHSVAKSLPERA